ncbi:hypothetical protein CBER1_04764 [Cercospora berteroae]|uniref:Apple domain-containing protein n=1 Tax=Cercospora berteroae TaxID=357750 RepID=A0A2S6CCY8_9PEZI|nr:hypothetical protein CBER1_04764 [Cercospora berteroae]
MPRTNRMWAVLPLRYTQVNAGPVVAGTCAPVAAVVTILNGFPQASSFCSSWLSIKTQSTTVTVTSVQTTKAFVTSTTGTNTFSAATVTSVGEIHVLTAPARTTTVTAEPTTITLDTVIVNADTSTISLTAEPTSVTGELVVETAATSVTTQTVDASTITIDAVTDTADTVTVTSTEFVTSTRLPAGLALLAGVARTRISSACGCLRLATPKSTITTTQQSVITTYETVNVAAQTTITPTFVETPISTMTPEVTEHETPRATITPFSTFVPLHTEYTTPTVYITPSSTSTPLSTELVTPTITVIPTTTITPSTVVYTTQTVQAKALPPAKCDGSGTPYIARDGSKYVLECTMDAQGNKLPGVPRVTVEGLEYCIDLCTREGTKCLAARWEPSTKLCELRSGYGSRFAATSAVHFAIRRANPTTQDSPQPFLVNGDFENGLAPWKHTRLETSSGCSPNRAWNLEGGKAYISYDVCAGTPNDELVQPVTLVAGTAWTFSAQVTFEVFGSGGNPNGGCSVTVDSFGGNLDASYGYGRRFERSVLQNGDFSSGALNPWTFRKSANTTVDVIGNAALISYPGGSTSNLEATLSQAISSAEYGQTYHFIAKVVFSFPSNVRTTCSMEVNIAGGRIYFMQNVNSDQTLSIDQRGSIISTAPNSLNIRANCGRSATPTPVVSIDDVSLTLNA